MKKLFILILLFGCINFYSCTSNDSQKESSKDTISKDTKSQSEKDAIVVAQNWLTLLDNEKYEESWDESAKIFQTAITKENWVSTVNNARSKTGKFLNRDISSSTYTTSLPGVPDCHYVVIQYNAKFDNNENAVETITPMKEEDGKWRVSGYFIK